LQSSHIKRHIQEPTTPTRIRTTKRNSDSELPVTRKRFTDFNLSKDFKSKKHSIFLRKAGEHVQLENVQKDHQIAQLQLQLAAYTNKQKRKKMQIAPEETFANVEAIKAVKDLSSAAAAKEAARATKYTKNLRAN
jgi:hypothetical protein